MSMAMTEVRRAAPRLGPIRNPLMLAGLLIVGTFLLAAIAAPWLAQHDPSAIDPANRLAGSTLSHPFGTDDLGRDLFSRTLHGARWSLSAAMVATFAIVCLGVCVGAVAGYAGGRFGESVTHMVDVVLAFPGLLLALAIAGALGPGLVSVLVGLVSVGWAGYARLTRGMILELRERNYIAAARALGATHSHIVIRHVLPNVVPAIVVLATVEMGELILALAAFGFLGLGAQPPVPEWGAMINDARPFVMGAPRLMIVPGAATALLVAGFNLLGDGLRDVLDPLGNHTWRVN